MGCGLMAHSPNIKFTEVAFFALTLKVMLLSAFTTGENGGAGGPHQLLILYVFTGNFCADAMVAHNKIAINRALLILFIFLNIDEMAITVLNS
jgi:hypothetical protein